MAERAAVVDIDNLREVAESIRKILPTAPQTTVMLEVLDDLEATRKERDHLEIALLQIADFDPYRDEMENRASETYLTTAEQEASGFHAQAAIANEALRQVKQ